MYQDAIEADVPINVPVAKHHSLARLSLGANNLLGRIFGGIDQAAAGAALAGVQQVNNGGGSYTGILP